MELCRDLGGMTLAEMDARMGAGELALWKAKAQVICPAAYGSAEADQRAGDGARASGSPGGDGAAQQALIGC